MLSKHVVAGECFPAAESGCTDHNAVLFAGVCPGGLPYAVRGLQEAQRRRIHAGGGRTERSSTGSAGQRGAVDGCLQPSGEWDESHRSHRRRRPVGDKPPRHHIPLSFADVLSWMFSELTKRTFGLICSVVLRLLWCTLFSPEFWELLVLLAQTFF